jgi:hypothetical protein
MAGPPSTHELALAARGERKVRGSYYTPPDVVDALLALTLEPVLAARAADGPEAVAALRIVDPACGAGNVLVAAARRVRDALRTGGLGEREAWAAAARCVVGVDLDPQAARLCRAALREASGGLLRAGDVARRVIVADAFTDPGAAPAGAPRPGRFDVVVGNPPFLNQLGAATARGAERADALRDRFGPVVSAYTDPAALFLLLGVELARPDGGVVGLIEPLSFLSTRDAGAVRDRVLADAAVTDLWVVGPRVFDAWVEVCVPVLAGGARPARTRLWRGRTPERAPDAPAPTAGDRSWAALLAAGASVPRRTPRTRGVVGDLAAATADFRDQYYGLAPHVVDRAEVDDEDAWPPLVTSGLIDPGRLRWGEHPTRFNKATYLHPRVDRAALPPALAAWATNRLVPKVLVATQTRAPEAVVDPTGRLLPSVPVITVTVDPARPADLWRVAAVLGAPEVAREVVRRHLGSGLNARAVRLRAADVLDLPLPADEQAWDAAAAALAAGAAAPDVAGLMNAAYGLGDDPELTAWWDSLLPRR